LRNKIAETLKQSKAEYTKIPIEDKETTWVSCSAQDLEIANATIDNPGMVLCLIWNKSWSVATLNGIDDLVPIINLAHQYARMGTDTEPIELARVKPVESVSTVILGI